MSFFKVSNIQHVTQFVNFTINLRHQSLFFVSVTNNLPFPFTMVDRCFPSRFSNLKINIFLFENFFKIMKVKNIYDEASKERVVILSNFQYHKRNES